MGIVVSIKSPFKSKLQNIKHKLFDCPTFWSIKPKFTCPICGAKYRCYWDGNDVGGFINVCEKCVDKVSNDE